LLSCSKREKRLRLGGNRLSGKPVVVEGEEEGGAMRAEVPAGVEEDVVEDADAAGEMDAVMPTADQWETTMVPS